MAASDTRIDEAWLIGRARFLLRERPFTASVAIVLAPAILALSFFTVRYETNDDAMMNFITSGIVFTNRPDEHMLFSNVVLGLALKSLYQTAPEVPWYGLHQVAALFLAAVAGVYALIRVNASFRQALASLLFVTVGVVPCLIEMQFTKTACIVSFSGFLLLLVPMFGVTPRPWLIDLCGCILVLWGSLIRFESCFLALVMVVPLAVVAAIHSPQRAPWRAVPIGLVLVAAAAFVQVNRSYYASEPAWTHFYEYNAVRAEFTDYKRFPYTAETAPFYLKAGWSVHDYAMLYNWFFADPDRYSLDQLKHLAATIPPAVPQSLGEVTINVFRNLPSHATLLVLIIGVICGAALTTSDRWSFITYVILFALPWFMTAYLGAYFWIPTRVAVPLFVAALAGGALVAGRDRAGRNAANSSPLDMPAAGSADDLRRSSQAKLAKKKRDASSTSPLAGSHLPHPATMRLNGLASTLVWYVRLLGAIAAPVLMIAAFVFMGQEDAAHALYRRGTMQIMTEIRRQPDMHSRASSASASRPLYVLWREWLPLEELQRPLIVDKSLRSFPCLPMGVLTPTPFAAERMQEFQITDIYEAICNRPETYVAAMDGLMGLFQGYVAEHYGYKVEPQVVVSAKTYPQFFNRNDVRAQIAVYQVRRINPPPQGDMPKEQKKGS
jgi:hypothetical protein